MIKTLIADDETIIRNGLKKLVEKHSDFEVVALAEDGAEAFELILDHLPDLVLLDINMPFLSGFEVIEKIKEIKEDIIIIIISGYDDFEYAKTAIKFGVFDYLLKPVTEQGLTEVLLKAKAELNVNAKNSNYLSFAKYQLEKNKGNLIKSFLVNWMEGSLTYDEAIHQCDFLEINLPENPALSIIHIKENVDVNKWEDHLLSYACENIACELFEKLSPFNVFSNSYGDIVILSEYSESLPDTLELLESNLQTYLPIKTKTKHKIIENYNDISHIYSIISENVYEDAKLPKLLLDAKEYVENNFQNPFLSLSELSSELHVTPQHISRLFKSHGLGTFGELLTGTRIRHALKLLDNPNLKMYEIAELSGYSSQHYFSSAFKKIFGVSPAEYRKQKN